jgi:DNA-binding NtrC family response regulator
MVATKKSILIVDDHPLFREGLKAIIAGDRHFVVEGEAGNARDGYAMAKKIKPDVALVDISLPDESGMQVTRRIREALPNTRVMIVSMHSKIDYIVEGLSGRRYRLCGQGIRRRQTGPGSALPLPKESIIWTAPSLTKWCHG